MTWSEEIYKGSRFRPVDGERERKKQRTSHTHYRIINKAKKRSTEAVPSSTVEGNVVGSLRHVFISILGIISSISEYGARIE